LGRVDHAPREREHFTHVNRYVPGKPYPPAIDAEQVDARAAKPPQGGAKTCRRMVLGGVRPERSGDAVSLLRTFLQSKKCKQTLGTVRQDDRPLVADELKPFEQREAHGRRCRGTEGSTDRSQGGGLCSLHRSDPNALCHALTLTKPKAVKYMQPIEVGKDEFLEALN
jgi:hypothetical protein